jgi:hypothetical protein
LVDISNYVMFEYGRPSHIFDLDKIRDGLVVRWGRAGEPLKLLNGNTIEVDEKVGVIADGRGQVESPATSMSKRRSGGPRPSLAARGATTSRRMPGIVSSAAWIRRRRSSTSSASPS